MRFSALGVPADGRALRPVLGEDNLKGFIVSAIATATDAPLLDPATGMPLEAVGAARTK
jgi:hypothetical protein